MMSRTISPKRISYLETARGIASVIVVFHHFLLGFAPELKAYVVYGGLRDTPFYMAVNGTGAVAFFFVLSGFVLTLRFYERFSMPDFVSSVLKRLPRLLLPAGLSMMLGASILIYFPDFYRDAAQLTGSSWLANFANVENSGNFVPSFADAARNSVLIFFLPLYETYNSNLWTMMYEFYGSLIVYLIAFAASCMFKKEWILVALTHLMALFLCIALQASYLVPFVAGSAIAFVYTKSPSLVTFPSWGKYILILVAAVGYSVEFWPALVLASSAIMLLLLSSPSLERRLSGPIGLFLGRLSFPLYLVHTLVMLSLTSAAYTILAEYGLARWAIVLLCLVLTLVVSLILAIPFMVLEKIWVPALNGWARMGVQRLFGARTIASSANLANAKRGAFSSSNDSSLG